MSMHVYDSPEQMSAAAASWICSLIGDTLKRKKRFSIVLSGGNTPKSVYQLFASSPLRESIEWNRLDFFWGDERFVPFEDERNNARMAYDMLLNHIQVSANQVHPMRTDIPPNASVAHYEKILKDYFEETRDKGFDLVLLGMGDDGHTLSLFPGTAVVHEEKAWVSAFFLESQDMFRITLTKHLVNLSAQVLFMTTGHGKSHALKEVIEGKYKPDLYPAQVIFPLDGELHWFVDKAAAAEL
ncbi:MAG: 6-phosphogluconolactonase [Chitinophagales bacterium]